MSFHRIGQNRRRKAPQRKQPAWDVSCVFFFFNAHFKHEDISYYFLQISMASCSFVMEMPFYYLLYNFSLMERSVIWILLEVFQSSRCRNGYLACFWSWGRESGRVQCWSHHPMVCHLVKELWAYPISASGIMGLLLPFTFSWIGHFCKKIVSQCNLGCL